MVTPLTREMDVDVDAVGRIVSNFVSHGVHVLLMGTTGEGNSVPVAMGERMVEAAARAAAGRITVYAGLPGNCVVEQKAAAERFIAAGADVIAATLPCYYALTPGQMQAYYAGMADFLKVPLVLYNIATTTHMSIPLDVIESLSHHPNIVGLKDSENDIGRMERALMMFAGRGDFSYFCGCAANSARAMALGADGIVPSVANYHPGIYKAIYEAGLAGDGALAMKLQGDTVPICRINTEGLTLGESLAGLKVIMKMAGLCEEHMLPPLAELSPEVASGIRERARDVLAGIGRADG